MAKNLAKVLKTDISRLPLRKAAEELRKRGRGKDTMLAHITPKEAAMLKARGGRGSINPDTGLPEFDDGLFFDATPIAQQPANFSAPSYTPETVTQAPVSYAGPDYTTGMQNVQSVQDGSLYQTPVYNTFQQPFQASEYAGTFQPDLGGGFTIPGQYASMNPDVQNAYRTAGQTLPADVAAKAYGDTSPVEFVQSGSPRDDALTLQMLGAQNAPSSAAPVAQDVAALTGDSNKPGGLYQPPSFEEFQKGVAGAGGAAAPTAAGGIQTPFGTLGTKDLIAALGLGGLGLNYLRSQQQGKSAAQQLQNAYDTAAQQQTQLAQPYMQQGGTQLAQALTGALSPAQQQQLQAGQAAAAQQAASSGGVAGAQAQRAVEDLRQRLLSNQQTMALQLLGAGTPLIGQAIQNQLSGTTTGINTQMALSQQAGQAATGMLGMLAMMYGRSA